MTLAFHSAETSPFVRALLADQGIADGGVELAIDARDEMLSFLVQSHDGDRERALFAYFRSGLSIAGALCHILRWRFGEGGQVGSLLDFASGYGRVTRFLLRELPADRVWVSDVYAEGVRFQEERFGVHGLVSSVRPDDFVCSQQFDAITVTSLFTHLPNGRFLAWLRVLLGLLRPGGVLVFSTHGPGVLGTGSPMPEAGILFQELSESGSLDTRDYGSTWVTETYVRSVVTRAAEESSEIGPISVHALSRGLCNFQDLYVAVREAGVDFSDLAFPWEPYLQIDRCALAGPDLLELHGWTVAMGGDVRTVEVVLDGRLAASAPVEGPRPDVAAELGSERFSHPGWSCRCPLPPGTSRTAAVLVVRVVDARGVGWPLWAGSIESLRLASAQQETGFALRTNRDLQEQLARAAAEQAALAARIAAMEASRFWKMRNAWFRLKRILGVDPG